MRKKVFFSGSEKIKGFDHLKDSLLTKNQMFSIRGGDDPPPPPPPEDPPDDPPDDPIIIPD